MTKYTDNKQIIEPLQVFSGSELKEMAAGIISSGTLGRSKIYAALLDYFVECSITGKSPKETDIAIDVFDKRSEFNVSKDASVRVYIHQLRKKLENYFNQHTDKHTYRLVIPKGQYALAAQRIQVEPETSFYANWLPQNPKVMLTLIVTTLLLFFSNIFLLLDRPAENSPPFSTRSEQPVVWQGILEDDTPLLLVMGDYYIFGELNDTGNIGRMVREFNINSPEDLEQWQFSDRESAYDYLDLNLSYIPEGSAFALSKIVPMLSSSEKRIAVKMMSDLTTTDLRENHVVYVGYISGLGELTDLVFSGSGLRIGRSYDELQEQSTLRYFTSDAGLPGLGQRFQDFGYFSTFPTSSDNQILIISGTRDAGLMYTAQALSDASVLDTLSQSVGKKNLGERPAIEVLFEVRGINRTHFEGNIVYSRLIDPALIWQRVSTSFRQ